MSQRGKDRGEEIEGNRQRGRDIEKRQRGRDRREDTEGKKERRDGGEEAKG